MTVTYSLDIATATFQATMKLFFRWKGSVLKLVWQELLAFLAMYFIISIVYRFALNQEQQSTFHKIAAYCEVNNSLIPIAFALGFFVTFVVGRWWEQFRSIPWPDRAAICIASSLHGRDEEGRLIRRTIVRYLNLATVLALSSVCVPVKKRFPSLQHLIDAGFMHANEQLIYENTPCAFNKFFLPLVWCSTLLSQARLDNRIKNDITFRLILDEILAYRTSLGTLTNYDWICVPLVYTQIVTLSIYTFFLFCLFGRQFTGGELLDPVFPIFTVLQFIFYMGWFKVAQTSLNPFGEDDDDFDANQLLDRHLQVAYMIVDSYSNYPTLHRDCHWDEVDFQLPYTWETEQLRMLKPYQGSAMDMAVNKKKVTNSAHHQPSIAEEVSIMVEPPPTTAPAVAQLKAVAAGASIISPPADGRRRTWPGKSKDAPPIIHPHTSRTRWSNRLKANKVTSGRTGSTSAASPSSKDTRDIEAVTGSQKPAN